MLKNICSENIVFNNFLQQILLLFTFKLNMLGFYNSIEQLSTLFSCIHVNQGNKLCSTFPKRKRFIFPPNYKRMVVTI